MGKQLKEREEKGHEEEKERKEMNGKQVKEREEKSHEEEKRRKEMNGKTEEKKGNEWENK